MHFLEAVYCDPCKARVRNVLEFKQMSQNLLRCFATPSALMSGTGFTFGLIQTSTKGVYWQKVT